MTRMPKYTAKALFRLRCLWVITWIYAVYPIALVLIPLKVLWDELPDQYRDATDHVALLSKRAWIRFADGNTERKWS